MSVKNDIRSELEAHRGEDISGQYLAEKLGVSRNAVWKAINSLKNDGYKITSSTNKGYCLSESCDILSQSTIERLCGENTDIKIFESLDSTNNEAKRETANGKTDKPLLIISEEQTLGRGRNGRNFYSPKGTGLYFSLVTSPKSDLTSAVGITSYAAVCVVEAIKELTGTDTKIKWVNDIYLDGKKLCGILTEAVSDFETGTVSNIIIGIGINLKTATMPDSLKDKVGFLEYDLPIKNELISLIVKKLLKYDEERNSFIERYKKYSLVLGKDIKYTKNNTEFYGTALDIDKDGGLIVKIENSMTVLKSGEISLYL